MGLGKMEPLTEVQKLGMRERSGPKGAQSRARRYNRAARVIAAAKGWKTRSLAQDGSKALARGTESLMGEALRHRNRLAKLGIANEVSPPLVLELGVREVARISDAGAPYLYGFYKYQRKYPPLSALDATERFLSLWPVGATITSNVLYGNGQHLRFSPVKITEAICQLESVGVLRRLSKKKWLLVAKPLGEGVTLSAGDSSYVPSVTTLKVLATFLETNTVIAPPAAPGAGGASV